MKELKIKCDICGKEWKPHPNLATSCLYWTLCQTPGVPLEILGKTCGSMDDICQSCTKKLLAKIEEMKKGVKI